MKLFSSNINGCDVLQRKVGIGTHEELSDWGNGRDLKTDACDTLTAVCDLLDSGYAGGGLAETHVGKSRATAVSGHFARRGYECELSYGVRGTVREEIAGVAFVYKKAELIILDKEEVLKGHILRIRLQVQRDKSEFDLLIVYMPAPHADEDRVKETNGAFEALVQVMRRIGKLYVAVGDFNAETMEAAKRRARAAPHRALHDGLLQQAEKELGFTRVGRLNTTYYQVIGHEVDETEAARRRALAQGYQLACAPPSAEALMEPRRLAGRWILFNWGAAGWCAGRLALNVKRQKVEG